MSMDQPIKVLYMEDDLGLAMLTRRALNQKGIEVEVAHTGEEGLKKFQEGVFDLVLVDYRMPGMTGMEVLEVITREKDPPPVIMVTGGGSEATAVEAMKLGASDYLVKDEVDSGYLELVPVVIQKVLARHRIFLEKKAAEEAKEQLIRELDAFAHTVAHDLKNPLYSVRLNMDRFYRLRQLSEEEATELLQSLDSSLLKMGNIIDELLLLATVRKEEVELEEINMAVIIQEAIGRLGFMIRDSRAEIVVQNDIPAAMGHAGWVEEVWTNYISNAIKYGGSPPRVEIGAERLKGGIVKCWVRDNGSGISREGQSRLFVPFSRLDSVRAAGHGLGLSIVHRIIEKLDGETSVESEPGKGSTFYFTLLAS